MKFVSISVRMYACPTFGFCSVTSFAYTNHLKFIKQSFEAQHTGQNLNMVMIPELCHSIYKIFGFHSLTIVFHDQILWDFYIIFLLPQYQTKIHVVMVPELCPCLVKLKVGASLFYGQGAVMVVII